MKKVKKIAAVAATMLVAAGVLTFEACNKKTEVLYTSVVENSIKHPDKIDDMDAYLKAFGEQMMNSKSDEGLSVAEAAWHLTAYQNYRFGDVDREYSDIVYDTKKYTIPVTNGMVSLADLNIVYGKSRKDIIDFYKTSLLDDKKIMYIESNITCPTGNGDGEVIMTVALTYRESSKNYYFYFDDWYDSAIFVEQVFPDGNQLFHWANEAPDTLMDRMRKYGPSSIDASIYERVYYSSFINDTFTHEEYPGRIFYCGNCTFNYTLDVAQMFYYLDSYLGLFVDNAPDGYEVVTDFIIPQIGNEYICEAPVPIYHILYVKYGFPVVSLDPTLD